MGTSREGTITGVLIDGMIPTIDTSQRGNWTSQLFTIQTVYILGFRFQSHVALQEVEMYVLLLSMYMTSHHTQASLEQHLVCGSMKLTSNMQNCENLTRVSIPLQTTFRVSSYFIEFTNPMQVHRLYIAEVRFSDQSIQQQLQHQRVLATIFHH